MATHRELIREKSHEFTLDIFYALYAWSNSLKQSRVASSIDNRKELEILLRNGYKMNISQFSGIMHSAYEKILTNSEYSISKTQRDFHLNRIMQEFIDNHQAEFELMGTKLTIHEKPAVHITTTSQYIGWLVNYLLWWILDAWPDSEVEVDFRLHSRFLLMKIHDLARPHPAREYSSENHAVLEVWLCLIDFLICTEFFGRCIWPKEGEPRKIEIFIPLKPPSAEELDSELPAWM